MRLVVLCLLLAASLLATDAARAETRLALVIANGAYEKLPALRNTQGDGAAIAAALTTARFQDASGAGPVKVRQNLGRADLQRELAAFRAQLAAAGEDAFGVVYFSGHGVSLGDYGDTALMAIDQDVSATDLMTRGRIAESLLGAGARTVVVVLDMCRNAVDGRAVAAAPIGKGGVSGAVPTKGLVRYAKAQRRTDQGYLVAYSTSPNQVAFDTGAFSRILAEEIRRPAQTVADVFKRVSDRVALQSNGLAWQKPTFDYGLQGDPPCFVSCSPTAASAGRFYDCANCPWMRVVPAGEALVGSPATEPGRRADEPVQQPVTIPRAFALGVYEVTLAEWAACEQDGVCRKRPNWSKDNPNPLIPASDIAYADAVAYVGWLSARSGRRYRLPTEAEWEYAARAGAPSAFEFGDDITPSQANYDHTARYRGSPVAPYRGYPEAVTGYPPNAFGFVQMSGNVWEWTDGCRGECAQRVVRGGSFQSAPDELRAANRFFLAASKSRADVGLRVARDLDPDEAVR